MGGGCSARHAEQPWILYLAARLCPLALPHDAGVFCQQLVGRLHVQARHDVVVGLPLVYRQLPPAVLQAVHPHVPVKPQLVRPVLADGTNFTSTWIF